jgi:dihydrofolate reductase
MRLSAIVAMANGSAIGRGGSIPWPPLRQDLAWFRAVTLGKPIVMGRRTWDSLPVQPLPGRHNIVLTSRFIRGVHLNSLGCEVANSADHVFSTLEALSGEEAVIVGGGSVYRQFLPRCDRVYLTRVDADYPGSDTFFPDLPADRWAETDVYRAWFTDPCGLRLRFFLYDRKPVLESAHVDDHPSS